MLRHTYLTTTLDARVDLRDFQIAVRQLIDRPCRRACIGSGPRAEVVDARVWLGIHFRFADVAARNLSIHVADWTLDHYFRPVEPED